ncbi:hypothetical protein BD779DRAFT_1471621 [Infundibulicybe gibba]|nr:hypothetical protein BD779DRAFT_1471621 [Infundibulicybe gibba]
MKGAPRVGVGMLWVKVSGAQGRTRCTHSVSERRARSASGNGSPRFHTRLGYSGEGGHSRGASDLGVACAHHRSIGDDNGEIALRCLGGKLGRGLRKGRMRLERSCGSPAAATPQRNAANYARILGAPAGRTMAPTGIAQQLVPQTTGGSHYCYHPGLPHCTTALAPPPPVRRTMLAVPLATSLSLPPAITTEHVFQLPQPPHRRYPTPTCVSAQHNTAPFYVVGAVAARISLPNSSELVLKPHVPKT